MTSDIERPAPVAPPPPTERPRRLGRWLLAGGLVVLVAGLVLVGWWLVDRYTVPVDDYDAVVAERDTLTSERDDLNAALSGAEAQIVELETERVGLLADLGAAEGENETLREQAAVIQEGLATVQDDLEANRGWAALWTADMMDWWVQERGGFDLSAEAIAAWDETAAQVGWYDSADLYDYDRIWFNDMWTSLLRILSGEETQAAFERFLETPEGSTEEANARSAFLARTHLEQMIVADRLLDTVASLMEEYSSAQSET